MADFAELVGPHLDDLFRLACRLEGDRVRAEDLVQAALLRGLDKHAQLRDRTSFKPWMMRVLRTTFTNRRQRRTELPMDVVELERVRAREAGPHRRLEDAHLGDRILLALDALPEERRLAVWLVDVQGMRFPEAAEVLGLPVGTVASRVARGRAQLRRVLADVARERGMIRC